MQSVEYPVELLTPLLTNSRTDPGKSLIERSPWQERLGSNFVAAGFDLPSAPALGAWIARQPRANIKMAVAHRIPRTIADPFRVPISGGDRSSLTQGGCRCDG